MGVLDAVKSATKVVAKNPVLKKAAIGGAMAVGTGVGGPVGGVVAGSVANSALKSGPAKAKKHKAMRESLSSHGSTDRALGESKPSTQSKGFLASLLSVFGL